jgi:hypothetical protein
MNYEQYVDTKRIEVKPSGFDPGALNPVLFHYQRDIVRWAIRRGKAALFEDAGLGKSLQEWEFAKQVFNHTGHPVLIVAPLSVSEQMSDEAPMFGYNINLCANGNELEPGINVTNYEKIGKFNPGVLGGLILDESGILKAGTFGKMSTMLTEFASNIPFRLAATATPSPNDLIEIVYHAEFLGIMRESEIKALYFTQDGNSSNQFRLKRNAVDKFYEWLASWAVAIRKPSDLGFADDGFDLPPLNIEQIVIDTTDQFANGTLFTMEAKGIADQRKARKNSIDERVQAVSDLVNNSTEQWLVWCDLNDESAALAKAIPDAVEVSGSSKDEHKIDAMRGFKSGKYRVVISKPQMWGFGLNLQNSWNAALCGLGNSFERYYQLIKRQHRFGQTHSVNVKVFVSPADGAVVENIKRKWKQNDELFGQLVKHMAVYTDLGQQTRHEMDYNPQQTIKIPAWLKKPVKTQTEPGMWWIDLDSIPFQIDGAIKNFWDGMNDLKLSEPMLVPQWVSTISHSRG